MKPPRLTERTPGRWSYRIEAPRLPGQKRTQKTITIRGTRADAEADYHRRRADQLSGNYSEPSKWTLAQLTARWLEDVEGRGRAPLTLENYRQKTRDYILPHLGSVQVARLRPLHVKDLYRTLRAAGAGPTVLANVHTILRIILNTAVRWEIIDRSPLVAVEAPPLPAPAVNTPDVGMARRILDLARGTRLEGAVLLTALTGMRRCEVLAARWRDLDWESGRLTIRVSKSKAGRRVLQLTAGQLTELRRWKAIQSARRIELAELWTDEDLIAPREDGTAWIGGSFSSAFCKLLRAAGLPRYRFHDLRHFAGTHMIASGIPLPVVSERLGHADSGVTLRVYAHAMPKDRERAAEVMDEVLGGGR